MLGVAVFSLGRIEGLSQGMLGSAVLPLSLGACWEEQAGCTRGRHVPSMCHTCAWGGARIETPPPPGLPSTRARAEVAPCALTRAGGAGPPPGLQGWWPTQHRAPEEHRRAPRDSIAEPPLPPPAGPAGTRSPRRARARFQPRSIFLLLQPRLFRRRLRPGDVGQPWQGPPGVRARARASSCPCSSPSCSSPSLVQGCAALLDP